MFLYDFQITVFKKICKKEKKILKQNRFQLTMLSDSCTYFVYPLLATTFV